MVLTSPLRLLPRHGVRVLGAVAVGVLASLWPEVAASADDSLVERAAQTERELREPPVTAERTWLQPGLSAPLDPTGRSLGEMAGVSVRWWARHGRANIGLGVGTVGFVVPAGDAFGVPPGALRAAVPTVTFGWRYHLSNDTAVYADATGARTLATDTAPGLYNTKVGMEWQPAKSKFGFENHSLGIQLQSGYRMSLRLKSGGVGVYFRGRF